MRQATPIKRTPVKTTTPQNRVETTLTKTSSCSNEEFNRKVQETAYKLYVERGCENGHDVEDWAKAEKIVRGA